MKTEKVSDIGQTLLPSGTDGGMLVMIVVAAVVLGLLAVFRVWVALAPQPKAAPRRRKRRRWTPRAQTAEAKHGARRLWDPREQVDAVSHVDFERRRLLNAGEYRVLTELEAVVGRYTKGWRVMAQVSLGEIIQPCATSASEQACRDARASINSKRLDFAVFDRDGFLVLAVEYQGRGHYHKQSFMRDAVKREALRRAGVQMLELEPEWDRTQLEAAFRKLVGLSPTPAHAGTPRDQAAAAARA
ncbi:DUF2726 domain-containing protein [Roseovarius salinarum]|uniref:DUF2726 domain-containing protein n=1 Tax=Roseovarius salinarum TaxID=1981892 RepID=UPI000C34332F|nr:DUF2726 domain-containing protein [Roseovarius salinarum]